MFPSVHGSLPHPLYRRWKTQTDRLAHRCTEGVGVAVLAPGCTDAPLVPAERLLFLTLDEPTIDGRPVLRLSAFRGVRVPFGFRVGGDGNHLATVDLRRLPGSASDPTLDRDLSQTLVRCGLKLQDKLLRARRDRPSGFRMPDLWAGFDPNACIEGDGPELSGRAHEAGLAPSELFRRTAKRFGGLVYHPLPWVSHHEDDIRLVAADLTGCPHYQCDRRATVDDLHGFRSTTEFDLRPVGEAVAC